MTSISSSDYDVSKIEISYQSRIPQSEKIQISHPSIAYRIFNHSWDHNKIELVEQTKILLVDRGNFCLGIADIGTGGTTSCSLDPRIVFSIAILSNAAGFILAHNHPSGNLMPSEVDKLTTWKLQEAGRLFDIPVLDHLILNKEDYFSFGNNKLLHPPTDSKKVRGRRGFSP